MARLLAVRDAPDQGLGRSGAASAAPAAAADGSDGIVEQRGPGGEFFGTDRLASALGPAQTEQEDVDNAFRALEAFAGRSTWDDDATLASFKLE